MAEFPALPLWTDAYLGDTTHLTTLEHGAYLLLMLAAWRTPTCALPDDDDRLARFARCTARQWLAIRPVIVEFWDVADGRWTQKRLLAERHAVEQISEIRSILGKRGGRRSAENRRAKLLENLKSGEAPATDLPQAKVKQTSSTHTHTHVSDTSVSDEQPGTVDPAKVVFDQGVKLLASVGISEARARPMLGKWRKAHGDAALIEALHRASVTAAIDIPAFIEGHFRKKAQTNGKRPSGNSFIEGAADLLREIGAKGGPGDSGGAGRQRPDDVSGERPVVPLRMVPAGAK